MKPSLVCCLALLLSGCLSISINYSKEMAKLLNEASTTQVLTDGKHFYVKSENKNFGYGPEGKVCQINQKQNKFYLTETTKQLKEVTGKYIIEVISQSFRQLIDIRVEEYATPENDDLMMYALSAKFQEESKQMPEAIAKLNIAIKAPQQKIIEMIRRLRQSGSQRELVMQIYRFLGEVEKEVRETCYDASVFRIPVIMELYFRIREQAYSKGIQEFDKK